ncbi:MAG: phosphoribosylamine--glycine ligase [candidate division Zixibacteria bacterium]|nr:phosphoribosylamine--glycine ligase [candidate division Zixibacteria bacterium]
MNQRKPQRPGDRRPGKSSSGENASGQGKSSRNQSRRRFPGLGKRRGNRPDQGSRRHSRGHRGGSRGSKVLIIGSGGREHALALKISASRLVSKVFVAPGSAAMAEFAQCVNIRQDNVSDLASLASRNQIDLTIVGPEVPLAAGIVDHFTKRSLKIFGPTRNAARLESSKSFARHFMRRHNIPTASYRVYDDPNTAITFLRTAEYPLVIKADGLAAGKGVVIANDFAQAADTVKQMMIKRVFGKAGETILIESCLQGPEVSIMAFCDGDSYWLMPPAQDHKRIGEGDIGPNTGGMGAYCPVSFVDEEFREVIDERVFGPVLKGMAQEGYPFKGILYAGLMLTSSGPKVLEFNCRFGDPETQVVLPLLESDLFEIMLKIANHRPAGVSQGPRKQSRKNESKRDSKESETNGVQFLRDLVDKYDTKEDETEPTAPAPSKKPQLQWSNKVSATVTLASRGYPGRPDVGKKISGLDNVDRANVTVYHAGTKKVGGNWITSGGRVLNITGIGDNLDSALATTYREIQKVSFNGMQFRRDIGKTKGAISASREVAQSTN